MKFCWTTLHVKNIDTSINFYKEIVGMEVNRRFKPSEHMELAFLGTAPTELELICNQETPASQSEGISIGFMIDGKLEDIIAKLTEKGFTEQSEVYSPNPFMRFFYVKDPDGFSVQFVEDNRS